MISLEGNMVKCEVRKEGLVVLDNPGADCLQAQIPAVVRFRRNLNNL